jgi:hypothetical protein
MEGGGYVHGGGGLSHPALLIDNGDDFCHWDASYVVGLKIDLCNFVL